MVEDNNDNPQVNSVLTEQFVAERKLFFETYFNNRLVEKYAHNPHLLSFMQDEAKENADKEILFVTKIISAYESWLSEQEVLVLWDIDSTMGKLSGEAFVLRPSLVDLFEFLRERFPNIKNGLLTNRVDLKLDTQPLSEIHEFIDPKERYSSREIKFDNNEVAEVEKRVNGLIRRPTNMDFIQKYLFITKLKKEGKNVKIIDDNEVSKCFGNDGVCVEECVPNL